MPIREAASPITPSADTWVREYAPTANYGSNTSLQIGLISGKAADDRRALLEFDLSAFGNSVELITKAELKVTSAGAIPLGITDVYVRKINRDFNPATATWNTYDGSNNWTSGGGDYDASTDYPIYPALGLVSVDITPLVIDAIKNESEVLRLVIMADSTPLSSPWQIRSLDFGTPEDRPYIDIEYAPKGRRLKRPILV